MTERRPYASTGLDTHTACRPWPAACGIAEQWLEAPTLSASAFLRRLGQGPCRRWASHNLLTHCDWFSSSQCRPALLDYATRMGQAFRRHFLLWSGGPVAR
jgi:hypothetical protein